MDHRSQSAFALAAFERVLQVYGLGDTALPDGLDRGRISRLRRKVKCLAQAGRFDEALTFQQEVAALVPHDPDVYMKLGILHWAVEKIEDAASAFHTASGLAPAKPDPHQALAELYLGQDRFEEAIREGKTLLRLTPGNINALDLLSTAYLKAGKLDKALDITTEMVRRSPLDPFGHYRCGLLHQERGEWHAALEAYQRAALIAPEGSLERQQAESAIESVDRKQIMEIMILASEDGIFHERLVRSVEEATTERGFYLSDEALAFVEGALTLEAVTGIANASAATYPTPPRPRLYN